MVLIKLSDEPCLYELIQLLLSSVINLMLGRGGGQVVSMLALYSDDPSSNPAETYNVHATCLNFQYRMGSQ